MLQAKVSQLKKKLTVMQHFFLYFQQRKSAAKRSSNGGRLMNELEVFVQKTDFEKKISLSTGNSNPCPILVQSLI